MPRIASIFFGSRLVRAGSIRLGGLTPFPPAVSLILVKTRPTALARDASSPMPPMCRNITLAVPEEWLCSARHLQSLVEATLIGVHLVFEEDEVAHDHGLIARAFERGPRGQASGGVIRTPAAVTARSVRGTETLKTPPSRRAPHWRPSGFDAGGCRALGEDQNQECSMHGFTSAMMDPIDRTANPQRHAEAGAGSDRFLVDDRRRGDFLQRRPRESRCDLFG